MNISRKTAMVLWEEEFGKEVYAEDFDGGLMYKYAYGSPDYHIIENGHKIYCGWNIHHILPKACGGTDKKENLLCVNIITNEQAGDNIAYWIGDKLYQVKRIKGTSDHAIHRIR